MQTKAIVIDFVGGACCGKSTMTALTFGELKILGEVAELCPEFAKELVWTKKYALLNNQHEVSRHQYENLKCISEQVDFVVTDGSLIHGLYYNRSNPNNVCQIDKTEQDILKWYKEFRHLVIYLERDPNAQYDIVGRVHSEEEARHADQALLKIMDVNGIKYVKMKSSRDTVSQVVKYALELKEIIKLNVSNGQ